MAETNELRKLIESLSNSKPAEVVYKTVERRPTPVQPAPQPAKKAKKSVEESVEESEKSIEKPKRAKVAKKPVEESDKPVEEPELPSKSVVEESAKPTDVATKEPQGPLITQQDIERWNLAATTTEKHEYKLEQILLDMEDLKRIKESI